MIWLLAALMQLSAPLRIESVSVARLYDIQDVARVVLRNHSAKIVTAFSLRERPGVFISRDMLGFEGIQPQGSLVFDVPIASQDAELHIEVAGVVFADETWEGAEGSEILAARDGKRHAELKTARQVRTFLQFNTVFDDSAMAVLDRELEEALPVPARWTTHYEKVTWQAEYSGTRKQIRKQLRETLPEHRRQQLESLGGRP